MKTKTKLSLKLLTTTALLIALEIVLSRFCSINTSGWKIGFSFVPVVVAAVMYGPTVAAIVYALSDFLGAILFPIGPYFPGFTVSAALMGFVYGLFLYRREEKPEHIVTIGDAALFRGKVSFFAHILPPVLINNLFFGLVVNTSWVSVLYSKKSYFGWFLYRLPEYALMIPVSLLLIPALIKLSRRIMKLK